MDETSQALSRVVGLAQLLCAAAWALSLITFVPGTLPEGAVPLTCATLWALSLLLAATAGWRGRRDPWVLGPGLLVMVVSGAGLGLQLAG